MSVFPEMARHEKVWSKAQVCEEFATVHVPVLRRIDEVTQNNDFVLPGSNATIPVSLPHIYFRFKAMDIIYAKCSLLVHTWTLGRWL